MFVVGSQLWTVANTFVRLSILHLYVVVFGAKGNLFRRSAYALMAVSIAYAVAGVLMLFLTCRPFAYTWDRSINGKCGSIYEEWLAMGILNLFLDVGVIVTPLPVLWRLQMTLFRKLALTMMFTIGIMLVSWVLAS